MLVGLEQGNSPPRPSPSARVSSRGRRAMGSRTTLSSQRRRPVAVPACRPMRISCWRKKWRAARRRGGATATRAAFSRARAPSVLLDRRSSLRDFGPGSQASASTNAAGESCGVFSTPCAMTRMAPWELTPGSIDARHSVELVDAEGAAHRPEVDDVSRANSRPTSRPFPSERRPQSAAGFCDTSTYSRSDSRR